MSSVSAGLNHSLAITGIATTSLGVQLLTPAWSNGRFSVSLPTQSGKVYALEYKNLLEDTEWIALPLVAGNGGEKTLTDPTATGAHRFYRVRRW